MKLRVGIVRDDRYLDHKPGHTHPEHPNRVKSIYRMLDSDFPEGLIPIEPAPATLEQLELVHTPSYIKKVLKTADHGYTSLAPDTPASAKTYLAAWLAAGGCIKALEALLGGDCQVCFSLVRPPGHHALPDRAGGFCILNNPAIAARYAVKHHGLRRVLIVDWDIHHGNGVNDLFYEDDRVLYFSSHDTLLYPYSGDWEQAGGNGGEGYTVNVPLPRDLTDEEFLCLYREVVGPVIKRYAPQLILVAAGFDGHHEDPVGRSRLTEKAFGRLTSLFLDLREKTGGAPIQFILEGGYDPRSLAGSVREVLRVLTGNETYGDVPGGGTDRVHEMVNRVRGIHGKYGVWTDA